MSAPVVRRSASVRVPSGAPQSAQGIWKTLLEGAARTAEFETSTILVLGKKDSGKSSVIRALQNIGSGKQTLSELETFGESYGVSGLDYAYFDVRAVDDADISEDLTKCNLWILQDVQHAFLLEPILSSQDLHHMVILICLDVSEPWTMKSQLAEWLGFAADFVASLMEALPVEEQEALRQRRKCYRSKIMGTSVDKEALLPVPSVNLGVPLVVCVAKSDAVVNLNTRQYPGRGDALLAHLRHLCWPYGAALCYVCTKDNLTSRNTELLYRYCVHRLFGIPFNQPIVLQPPEAIFIPSGWDDPEEIKEFAKNTVAGDFDVPLESVLPPPPTALPSVSAAAVYTTKHGVDFVVNYQQPSTTTTALDSTVIKSMDEFLSELLAKDPGLSQRDKTLTRRTSDNYDDRLTTATTSSGEKRNVVEQPNTAREIPQRKTVIYPAREVTELDTARLNTARRHGDGSSTTRGDTESLRQFFQTLLTKQPTAGSSTARHRPSADTLPTQKTKPENL